MAVAFLTGSHELHLYFGNILILWAITPLPLPYLDLCGTEILEHAQVGTLSQQLLQTLGDLNTTAHDNDVNVCRRTLQEDVAHIASYHIAFHPQTVGNCRNLVEDVLVQYMG